MGMLQINSSKARWVCLLIFAGFAMLGISGCTTAIDATVLVEAKSLSQDQRDRVSVVVINSPLDPLTVTGLPGLAGAVEKAGYNVELLGVASGEGLAKRAREAHGDANAIALIVWSGASLWVHDALTLLDESNERVELVIYMDSNWIKDRVKRDGHPSNADRVVGVYRKDNPSPAIDGLIRYDVDEWNHLSVVRRKETATAVVRELTKLAQSMESESTDSEGNSEENSGGSSGGNSGGSSGGAFE